MRDGIPKITGKTELNGACHDFPVDGSNHDLRERFKCVKHRIGPTHQTNHIVFGQAGANRGVEQAHREEVVAAAGDHQHMGFGVIAQL